MHTPGPWRVTFNARGQLHEIEAGSPDDDSYRHLTNALPFVASPGEPRDEAGNSLEMISNARLMATSPELLRALELAEQHISWLWDHVEEHTRLRREGSQHIHDQLADAIAKARKE